MNGAAFVNERRYKTLWRDLEEFFVLGKMNME